MATAGTPDRATPDRKRRTSRVCQSGATATPRVRPTTRSWEVAISTLRPSRSEAMPIGISDTATPMVAADTAQLAPAASTPKLVENNGSSGCTQYSSAKVAKPQQNRAIEALR